MSETTIWAILAILGWALALIFLIALVRAGDDKRELESRHGALIDTSWRYMTELAHRRADEAAATSEDQK